jgi:hypothetical protein
MSRYNAQHLDLPEDDEPVPRRPFKPRRKPKTPERDLKIKTPERGQQLTTRD